jgi:hypothetical protein
MGGARQPASWQEDGCKCCGNITECMCQETWKMTLCRFQIFSPRYSVPDGRTYFGQGVVPEAYGIVLWDTSSMLGTGPPRQPRAIFDAAVPQPRAGSAGTGVGCFQHRRGRVPLESCAECEWNQKGPGAPCAKKGPKPYRAFRERRTA